MNLKHPDIKEYKGYAPIVNEFFDIASDQERSNEIIPFLRKITGEERELIGDAIKKRDLAVRIDNEMPFKGDWHTEEGRERRVREIMDEIERQCGYIPRFLKHDRNITRAFRLARYVCFSRGQMKDVEWNWYTFPISGELKEMMEWYIPEWFAEYVKEQRNKRNLQLTYSEILHWRRLGLLDSVPHNEIASSIPSHFRKPENLDAATYIHDKIDKYPEILDEIKYLFQYPSGAYYVDSGNYAQKEFENKGPLSYIFRHYSDEGKLDRQWIIREAVNACGNNFEKEQLYWYPVLLQAMEPTKDELIANQEGLINNLTSVFPQISLAMLKLLRTIADDSRFMIDHFIGHLTGLFSSETKTLVKATLSAVTDLLKIYPDKRNALCEQLAVIFIHKNEELQTRTAKLIARYGDKKVLEPILASYNETLLMSAKEILEDFLGEDTPPSTSKMEEEPAISRPIVRDDNRVAEIDSVEELVFRLGQAFEDFRLDSIDLIPQALIRFSPEIDGEVLQQFSPAIKGAEKVLTKWMRGKRFIDEITAFYFLYYCSIRLQQLDQEDKTVKQVAKRFGKLQPVMDEWIKKLLKDDQNVPFTPYLDTLNMFLKIVQDKPDLPLLSTPTHEPCWIDPIVFLERFNRYKELQETPAMFDMQLAIQRLALDHPEEALKQFGIGKEEKAFYPELFTYLFDRNKPLPEKIEHPDLWLTCTVPWYGREIPERL
ncbi:MAG: DUF6493 family protein, partial [Bacteroidales bacterium]|nr:DUF6493 family protein [Bacteroidales bacterium]